MIIHWRCRVNEVVVKDEEEEGATEEQTIININNFQQLNQVYNAIIITSTTIKTNNSPRGGEMKRSGRNYSAKNSSDTVNSCPKRNALQL